MSGASISVDFAQTISGTDTTNISGTGNTNLRSRTSITHCAVCARAPRLAPIKRTVAPLAYAGCAGALVQQQKNRSGAVAARLLAELLGDAVLQHYALEPTQPSLLIPVPLHWRREWQRGYNQSAILGSHIAKRLGLPLATHIAYRTRATQSQQQLNIINRATNMQGAFAIGGSKKIRDTLNNATVAIIDDVITTGATAQSLACCLQAAGAAEIHLWSPTRAILQPTDQSRAHAREQQEQKPASDP